MNSNWERFYSAYPRKEGRGAALKAWEKITHDMSPEELEAFTTKAVMAIDAQKRTRWDASERKFIPMPVTWLNQCRWDDEIPSATDTKVRHADMCECGEKAFNGHQCARCYTKMANPGFGEAIKQTLRRLGFTKSKDESWREACIRTLKANGMTIPEHLK